MRHPDFHRSIGKRIESLRKQHELTQSELARLLGVSPQTVFCLELGSRRVPLDLVPALMRVFRVSCEELLGLRPLQPMPMRRVSPSELRLVEQIRLLARRDRRVVKRVAEALTR